jgi:hypothetical protein
VFAAEFGSGQVLWSFIWFFLFIIWIILLFRVFGDIFRSRDMGGVSKFIWTFFVILFPYLGVFVYLIARGDKMATNDIEAAKAQEESFRAYVRDAAGGGEASVASELERLAGLRDKGVISDEEFAALKAKAISG